MCDKDERRSYFLIESFGRSIHLARLGSAIFWRSLTLKRVRKWQRRVQLFESRGIYWKVILPFIFTYKIVKQAWKYLIFLGISKELRRAVWDAEKSHSRCTPISKKEKRWHESSPGLLEVVLYLQVIWKNAPCYSSNPAWWVAKRWFEKCYF